MAPFTCGVIDSDGQPVPGVQVVFDQFRSDHSVDRWQATTSIDGYVTSWFRHDGKSKRGLTFLDGKPIQGFLIFSQLAGPHRSPWRRIYVNIDLAGESHHCILLRLLGHYQYTIRQDSFLPTQNLKTRTYNSLNWSAQEDQQLLALRSEGWASEQICAHGLIPGRTREALTSRYKVLSRKLRRELRQCAERQREGL